MGLDPYSRADIGPRQPVTSAVDFSNSRPAPAALKAAGVTYVIRYIDRPSWPKSLSRAEAEGYLSQGLRVVLNFEEQANQATFGAGQGSQDAAAANGYADAIGAPQTAEIYYSCDTGATFDQVAPYYRAAKAFGHRPVSFYGGLSVGLALKSEGTVTNVWCANAASWSGFRSWDQMAAAARAQGATILQHLDHPLPGIDPAAYDFNEVLGAPLAWGDPYVPPQPKPAPPPPISKDAMLFFYHVTDNAAVSPNSIFVSNGFVTRHVGNPDELRVLQFLATEQGVANAFNVGSLPYAVHATFKAA